jgi:predicted regulator of Ras-like GTPase activity (Roadblock/LC7/MglB family)
VDATNDRQHGPEVSKDVARRLGFALAKIDGVRGVLVCSKDGAVLDSNGQVDPPRDAALTSFLGTRAESLSIDSDLRGMGRMLAGSKLESMTLSSPSGESMLLPAGSAYLFVSLMPGRPAASIGPLAATTARRYL